MNDNDKQMVVVAIEDRDLTDDEIEALFLKACSAMTGRDVKVASPGLTNT